jgi:hypothetical protein
MRKKNARPLPKILLRGEGAGALAESDVERRAQEIARIAGHRRVSADDVKQARAELRNETLPPTTGEDVVAERGVSRDPSEPPARRGRRTRTSPENDLQNDVERMVVEGVEEAQHEQMVAARRRRRVDQ